MLWCFVFQHLGKHALFHSGFFLRNGDPFLWCCSGALCADFWRFSFFGLLVVCAVVLGWLWARRVWPGRLGPGIILVVFLVATLAPEMVTWILSKCSKTNWFGAIYARRAARRIVACEPLCSESSCFLERFCEFGGHILVQNELVCAELGVSFGVCSVLFRALCGFFLGALDWVVGWLAPLWPDLDAGFLWPGVSFESFFGPSVA